MNAKAKKEVPSKTDKKETAAIDKSKQTDTAKKEAVQAVQKAAAEGSSVAKAVSGETTKTNKNPGDKNASTGDAKADANFTHEVSAKGCDRRCRAGKCFTKTPTPVSKHDFTEDQQKALDADPYLHIEPLDANH